MITMDHSKSSLKDLDHTASWQSIWWAMVAIMLNTYLQQPTLLLSLPYRYRLDSLILPILRLFDAIFLWAELLRSIHSGADLCIHYVVGQTFERTMSNIYRIFSLSLHTYLLWEVIRQKLNVQWHLGREFRLDIAFGGYKERFIIF